MMRSMHSTKLGTATFALLLVGLLVMLAACGTSTTTTGATNNANQTPASSGDSGSSGYGGYGHPAGKTPTASASNVLVKTGTATVSGEAETVLTNAQGLTLYYRSSDVPPGSVCSGGCASAWPPLLASGSGAPTSATALPGTLSVQTTANGSQVEYNGHPLYTFASDTAAGQATGEGVAGVWHVVTPSLT